MYEYIDKNPEAKSGFKSWMRVLDGSRWNMPSDIIKSFNTADTLANGTKRVVFNISGNKYRCICTYSFGSIYVHLFINWIGTHSAYDRLCDKKLQYKISNY